MARKHPPRPRRAPAPRPPGAARATAPADRTLPVAPRRTRAALRVLLPTAVSAVLLFLAYPLPDQSWTAWVALVPWVVVVLKARRGAIAWATWPVWLAWWLVMVRWLTSPTIPGWIGLSLYVSLYFPVAALLLRLLRRRFRVPTVLGLPIVQVGLDCIRGATRYGFPWFYLGHTQHANLPLKQVADLVGVGGITFLVAAVNGLVVDLLIEPIFSGKGVRPPDVKGSDPFSRPRLRRAVVIQVAGVAALLVAVVAYGRYRLAEGQHTITQGLRVAAIQGNFPQHPSQLEIAEEVALLDTHLALNTEAVAAGQPLDLIVWPETTVPGSINQEYLTFVPEGEDTEAVQRIRDNQAWSRYYHARVVRAAREAGVPLLVGNGTLRPEAGEWRQYNSALLVEPTGAIAGRYDKMHLVPFGEYIPAKRWFPWLQDLTPYDYDHSLSFGRDLTVFHAPRGDVAGSEPARFAVAICFEDTVPRVVRRLAYAPGEGKRIDFLANISNDGWFGASSELPQHLAIASFRAVENRVGIVRAVNTGISAFIDPNGRVVKDLRQDGQRRGISGFLLGRVAEDRRTTLYQRWGEWFAWSCAGLVAAAVVWQTGWSVLRRLGGLGAGKN